jgi:ribosomal protein L16 Arg81 hydroxylase
MYPKAFGVDWLLAPANPAYFFQEYWEKRPFTLQRGDARYYRRLLTLADVDHLLASHDLKFPCIAMYKDRKPVPLPHYTVDMERKRGKLDGVIDAVKLYSEYAEGGTIILDHLHRSWPPLGRLCAAMEEHFSHPAQTNVYLTPPHSQGFAPHYDTHDVFILQMAGSKRWRLYSAPLELPLPSQPYPPTTPPGQATADIELNMGDLLYLPRGWMHEARSSDRTSIHVTLGIAVQTWADVVREAVNNLVESDVRFRRALPIGFARDAAPDQARGQCAELTRAFLDSLRLEKHLERKAESFVQGRLPDLAGHLTDLDNLSRLTPQSHLAKRAWMYRVNLQGDSVVLLFHGKRIALPRSVEPLLQFMIGNDVFTADSLPGPLDRSGKMDLIRKLIVESFLTTVTNDLSARDGAVQYPRRNGVLEEKS